MNRMLRPVFMTLLIVLGGLSTPLAEETASAKAKTTGDPEIPVDELELKLRPLMRDELKLETDAWLKLLEGKVAEISRADIAVKYKKKEIALAEKLEAAFVQLDEAKKEVDKTATDAESRMTVEEAERALEETKAGELLAEELRLAQEALGEITGAVTSDDLLGRIFSEFCIGK